MPVSEVEGFFAAETKPGEALGSVTEVASVAGTRDATTQTEKELSHKQTPPRETGMSNNRISISKLLV